MKIGTKIVLSLVGLVVLIVAAWQLYLTFEFRLYKGYTGSIRNEYTYETGTEFKKLATPTSGAVEGMSLAAETDRLQLWIDTESAAAAVRDKISGSVTYTNPPEADADENANGINKSILKSQIAIGYYDANRRLDTTFNSFDLAVSMGQVTYEGLKDGLRVIYDMGDNKSPTGILPRYILEESLDKLLEPLEEARRKNIRNRWAPLPGYPGVLELAESVRNSASVLRQIQSAFDKQLGYTEADYERDMEESGVEGAMPIGFTIPLEYRLDGDSLRVSVPSGHVEERGGGKIESIQILRYFDAAGVADQGYMMVPNGSGSVINFNNGKTYAEDYRQYIYDLDPLLQDYAVLGNTETARLPYFGIEKTDSTILAQIESGESLALVTASVAGKLNSYNYVYSTFYLRGAQKLSMFGADGTAAELPVVEATKADIELVVRYSFLGEDYKGYSGMARYAHNKLTEQGVLKPDGENGDIPFYMDLVGGIQARRFFLSVPYKGMVTMTNFEQATDIVGALTAQGISNQVVNYQGWFNRGYYHDVVHNVKADSGMGSVKTLEKLSDTLVAQGGKLYSDVILQNVPWSSEDGHGYNWQYENSRYYGSGFVAAFGPVNPTSLYQSGGFGYSDMMWNQLSPKFLTRYVDSFLKGIKKYDVYGIALRDLGSVVASDRKRTEPISREEAIDIIQDNLNKIAEKYPTMLSGGNFYALKSADDLINVPLSHNSLYIVDEEIPFYEMLLHGSVSYTGSPINLSDSYDEDKIALRLIEFGASPHFSFTYEDSSEMKSTALSTMYSTTFSSWEDTAVRIYKTVNEVLSLVSGQSIVSHETLSEGVKLVTYSGGTRIYINYSSGEVTVGGVTVGAMSYAVKEGAA
ncbi:hypothetical protein FACS1894217_02900 [Clostridia bacterium]|nr:hypothetical protein FACS1894217_02900 [Clostridia bacterium]